MARAPKSYTIRGAEKKEYLDRLDSALDVLSEALLQGKGEHLSQTIREFGEVEGWNWKRLPDQVDNPRTLSNLVRRIQNEYTWFHWLVFPDDPMKNRGYFEELTLNTETGLPWQWDMMQLPDLKENAEKELEKLGPYEELAKKFVRLLGTDFVKIDDVDEKASALHCTEMKRNFLKMLSETDILPQDISGYHMQPQIRKLITLGGETCWNVSSIVYSHATGMFHIYMLDFWQDILEPLVVEHGNEIRVESNLMNRFRTVSEVSGWHVLKSIDQDFKSIHPVYFANATIGPFENKYQVRGEKRKQLGITSQLLKEDPNFGILRATIKYSFSPNSYSDPKTGETRQVVHMEDWKDHILVVPGGYSSKVASSVEGTEVRIVEM